MMVPLCDSRGRIIGWVKADNRKGPDGRPNRLVAFDEADEALATILAYQMVVVLELMRLLRLSDELLTAGLRENSQDMFLRSLLHRAIRLLGANRGDVCWADANGRLRMVAKVGECNLEVAELANSSICGWVFRTGHARLVSDVHDKEANPDYQECCRLTRSEIVVPLTLPPPASDAEGKGRTLGVLNIEAFEPNAFRKADLAVLQYLAHHAMPVLQSIEIRNGIRDRVLEQSGGRSPIQALALDNILEAVEQGLGFDCGVIYLADYQTGTLQIAAARTDTNYSVSLPFGRESIAGQVFHDGVPYYTPSAPDDPKVDRRALAGFGTTGALIGVPLLFGRTPVGVLMSWSKVGRQPQESDQSALEPYARLAVTTLSVSDADLKRRELLESIRTVLTRMQRSRSRRELLRLVMEGVVSHAGFERSRVFEYCRRDHAFVCVGSFGRERPNYYQKKTIVHRIDDSRYAKMTFDMAQQESPAPTVRDPAEHGPDPYAAELDKPADLPWAVAPLVIHDTLYGYIAADNAESRHLITDINLKYLGLFAVLAAQSIAYGVQHCSDAKQSQSAE
jgi:GAF domain-containing protein